MIIQGVRLRVYRIACRRSGVRAYSGTVWAVADPRGTVLCYSIQYPSIALLEDAAHAVTHAA